jgi:hypothetical protein
VQHGGRAVVLPLDPGDPDADAIRHLGVLQQLD